MWAPGPYPASQHTLEASYKKTGRHSRQYLSIAHYHKGKLAFPCLLPPHTDRQAAGIDAKVEQRYSWVSSGYKITTGASGRTGVSLGKSPSQAQCWYLASHSLVQSGERIRTCLRPEALLQHWREGLPLQLLNEICMTEGWKRGALLVWSRGVTWGRPCGLTVGGKGGQQGHSQLHKMLANSLRVEDSHASCLCG